MALEDLTAAFENLRNPGEGVDTETVLSTIQQVYVEDLSIRDTAVQARVAELEAANETIRSLKEKNYDLLMKAGNSNVGGDGGKPSDNEQDRSATVTFADIFNKGEK